MDFDFNEGRAKTFLNKIDETMSAADFTNFDGADDDDDDDDASVVSSVSSVSSIDENENAVEMTGPVLRRASLLSMQKANVGNTSKAEEKSKKKQEDSAKRIERKKDFKMVYLDDEGEVSEACERSLRAKPASEACKRSLRAKPASELFEHPVRGNHMAFSNRYKTKLTIFRFRNHYLLGAGSNFHEREPHDLPQSPVAVEGQP